MDHSKDTDNAKQWLHQQPQSHETRATCDAGVHAYIPELWYMHAVRYDLNMALKQLSTIVYVAMQTAAATSTVSSSMETAGKAMAGMNQVNDPVKMQQTMQQFAKQNAQMDMASEMMDDAIDDAMDDSDAEDESNDVVNQLLDDIGVDLSGKMASAPKGRLAQAQQKQASSSQEADDLTARLGALR